MKIIDAMKDSRINCYSIMLKMNVKRYLEIIKDVYKDNGGIEGQRIPLKTKTAKRIRQSMKIDIKKGAVLPPIVIGCIKESLDGLKDCEINFKEDEFETKIKSILGEKNLSIIDGMQRTTALKEVICENPDIKLGCLRIDLWITNSANNLIYRMLVLNTGQISWGLKKQLEVVFKHVKNEIINNIDDLKLLESNDGKRAKGPGEYQYSHLVELYLVFSIRKGDVKLAEKVAEQFAKLDIIDLSSNEKYLTYFIKTFKVLVELDKIFSTKNSLDKRIFGNQQARIGFILAFARNMFGRSGSKIDFKKIDEKATNLLGEANKFIEKLQSVESSRLKKFFEEDELKEVLETISSKSDEIDFYYKSFSVLIEEKFKNEDMSICWRSYE